MAKMHHPFICNLHGLYQDSRNLYMLEDFLQFGELLNVLKKFKRLDGNMTRFYAAQIVEVFEHIHSMDLIYRDLKPENVLLMNNGYVKLTDFGFVKKIKPWDRTYTLCGTPEYMAPEIITNSGHGRAADWYTLGIFIYELFMGLPPFMHNDTYEIFKMTLRQKIPFPAGFSSDAKSLIRHLTDHDLSKRFGNLMNGSKDVKDHRFFKKIDWKTLKSMQDAAPYIPGQSPVRLAGKGLRLAFIDENQEGHSHAVPEEKNFFKEWF